MPGSDEREEEDRNFSKLKSLYEITRVFNSSADLKDTYPRILSLLSQNMGMKRGGFLMMNGESSEWEIGGAHGLSGEEMKRRKEYFGSGVVKRIMEKGQQAAVVDGGESIWLFDGKARTSLKRAGASFLCAPVKIQGSITGILGVDHFFGESIAVTEDFHFLNEICSVIGDAMMVRKEMAAENRALVEENWVFRKELENLGRNLPKALKKIPLTEILEERLSRMIAEMKVDPRSRSHLYNEVLIVVERTLLKSALEKTSHVQLKTARFLGINRNTLRRKMKEMGIAAAEK